MMEPQTADGQALVREARKCAYRTAWKAVSRALCESQIPGSCEVPPEFKGRRAAELEYIAAFGEGRLDAMEIFFPDVAQRELEHARELCGAAGAELDAIERSERDGAAERLTDEPALYAGGQGRSAASTAKDSAIVTFCCVMAAALIVAAAVIQILKAN